jgi:WD40 repeat protein
VKTHVLSVRGVALLLPVLGICHLSGEPSVAQAPKPQATLNGHSLGVTSLKFTGDGKMLASGSEDKTVKFWDVTTGKCIRTLKGHTGIVNSVAFTADGKMLASGGHGLQRGMFCGEVKLWDVTTGKERTILKGHSKWVNSVAFSPDNKTLASGSDDHEVKLWDAATGKEIRTLKGHTSSVSAVAFTPDGKILVSSGSGLYLGKGKSILGEVKLWDVNTGREKRTLKAHSHFVTAVAVSGDGKTMAAGDRDRVTVWDVATGKELRTLRGPTVITSVLFSADGKMLAAGGDDGKSVGQAVSIEPRIKFWDVATGKVRSTWEVEGSKCVTFSPDGKTLASGGSLDGAVALRDVPAAQRAK